MARYTGPKTKIARTFGEAIFGYDRAYERRAKKNKAYPPGQHGATRKRGAVKEYALQLKEKQKAKAIYGLLERQFRNLFAMAHRKEGVTGVVLLQLLESRLDNVVYRMGIAPSRRAARQLVSHGHITVNGKSTNIPSLLLRPTDKVSVFEKSRDFVVIKASLAGRSKQQYSWLDWNNEKMEGVLIALPEREQIPENIKEQLIVELYSK